MPNFDLTKKNFICKLNCLGTINYLIDYYLKGRMEGEFSKITFSGSYLKTLHCLEGRVITFTPIILG